MTKSWELEALALKNERQKPIMVTVRIDEDVSDPMNRDIKSIGGSGLGYVKIYGKLTALQRSKLLLHMEKYVKLLIAEGEQEVAFRREWDESEGGREEMTRNLALRYFLMSNIYANRYPASAKDFRDAIPPEILTNENIEEIFNVAAELISEGWTTRMIRRYLRSSKIW